MTGNAIAMHICAEGPLGLQALQLACLAQTMSPTRCFKNVLHAPPETVKLMQRIRKASGQLRARIEKTNQARRIFVIRAREERTPVHQYYHVLIRDRVVVGAPHRSSL